MSREEQGFGITTVMAGAVVLGIFALVYVQIAQNRANFSQITGLMSFSEQVMNYYSSVLSNRGTWECTIRANSALKGYLQMTGTDTSGALKVNDYSGHCQEGFASSDGALLIDRTGRGFSRQEIKKLSAAAPPACDNTADGTLFCLKATWKGLDTGTGQRRAVELKLTLAANREAIKKQLGVNFTLKDKERTIYMNRTVATDCTDSRVTGHYPGPYAPYARHPAGTGVTAYAGDAAIVSLDAVTGLVQCSTRGPLVVPPCYDVTSTTNNPFRSSSRMGRMRVNGVLVDKGFGHLTSNVGLVCNSGSIKGSCPSTSGSGTTAIAYFDPQTGIAQCSHPNILVEKITSTVCGSNSDSRHGVVRLIRSGSNVGTFECSSSRWSNRGGVQPGRGRSCTTGQVIAGFDNTGLISTCIDSDGQGTENAMRGLSGPQGERGDSAAWVHSQCRGDSNCRHERRYWMGYGNYETHPAGPGVGSRNWQRGQDRPCSSGCFASYYECPRCVSPNCS